MQTQIIELLSASLTRRKLGTLEGNDLVLSFMDPPMRLPVSSALADLSRVPASELPRAVEQLVDSLESLDGSVPFRFSHAATHAGLDAELDLHQYPAQFELAPALRLMLNPARAWWARETGSAEGSIDLAAKWMGERTEVKKRQHVFEFSGRYALCAFFALGQELKGAPVVMFIDERTVWLTGDLDDEGLAEGYVLMMEHLASLATTTRPVVICGEVYRRHGPGDLRRWVPPEGHSLRDDFIALRRMALRMTYRFQTGLLAGRGVPLPVAEVLGDGDAPVEVGCSAFPCLVPAAEAVHFETGVVPFAGLLASSMLKRLPLQTPWFELSRSPTRAEAVALAHVPSSWADLG